MNITAEEAEQAMLAGGLPEPAVKLVSALRAYERRGSNSALTKTVEELLGRPPRPYSSVVQQLLASLKAAHRESGGSRRVTA